MHPRGDFGREAPGAPPTGWSVTSPRPALAPVFRVVRRGGHSVLLAGGNGRPDCVGHLSTRVTLEGGRWYALATRFTLSSRLNPHDSLLFSVYGHDFNQGIQSYRRLASGVVEGETRFQAPEPGAADAELRLTFRHSASGKVWIERLTLEPCEPVPPRTVRVACTGGKADLETWGGVVDTAAREGAELVLLPEMMNGETPEGPRGPSATLLADRAAANGVHVAGGLYLHERSSDTLYNTCLLFDGRGRRVGRYDKHHPYSPEILSLGVTPGHEVPVFDVKPARLGMMICYDSWFGDVAQLLALKGAEIILFPNAGYYRSLIPARAADNGVWVVASSLDMGHGIWDTTGAEVTNPDADPTRHPRDPAAFRDVAVHTVGAVAVLLATLDLSRKPSPHNWGGPMLSAPGGRRNRRDLLHPLWREIERESERWWEVDR